MRSRMPSHLGGQQGHSRPLPAGLNPTSILSPLPRFVRRAVVPSRPYASSQQRIRLSPVGPSLSLHCTSLLFTLILSSSPLPLLHGSNSKTPRSHSRHHPEICLPSFHFFTTPRIPEKHEKRSGPRKTYVRLTRVRSNRERIDRLEG